MSLAQILTLHCEFQNDLGMTYPQWLFNQKRLIFVALCNDLIDYFIVCFEHQCNTMRVFQKAA